MRAVDIIAKKRDGGILSAQEIQFFLNGYQINDIPDYQMSALLMAIYLKGMNDDELFQFTKAMVDSGITIEFNDQNFVVDKHSSGGVGDKITLALSPLLAALGVQSAKLSGRGLGHTGGTIDKFEAIPGFRFSKTQEALKEMMDSNGFGLMGACPDVVPLDKKIYNLRDVTGTVGAIPLMVSSILSKKIALKTDLILLDLKVGSGAFIDTVENGKYLADKMQTIAKMFNRKLICMLTNMNQPLGFCIGNLNEVLEASYALQNKVNNDFTYLLKHISAKILVEKKNCSEKEAFDLIEEVLNNGDAYQKLIHFINKSDGDSSILELKMTDVYTKKTCHVLAEEEGYVHSIDTKRIGDIAMKIGAGRETKEDFIDHKAGIYMTIKIGDHIKKNDVLMRLDYNKTIDKEAFYKDALSAIKIKPEIVQPTKVVYQTIY
ncbi:MAG: thymidine phosphorylase [Flavobacteriales bacterium]